MKWSQFCKEYHTFEEVHFSPMAGLEVGRGTRWYVVQLPMWLKKGINLYQKQMRQDCSEASENCCVSFEEKD